MSDKTMTITIPEALGEVEIVSTFMGYSKGARVDSTSGEPSVTVGVPTAHKYEGMKVTDRPGAMMYFIVLAPVRQELDLED